MKTTVLVVDDQEQNRQVCQENLEMEGFEVVLAANGQEALELVDKIDLDILLLDVMMPVMNGWEVLEKMKANDTLKDIPVIMLTALSEPKDQKRALQMGACDFIIKPFDIDVMIARLRTHSELKKARDLLEKRNRKLTANIEQARHLTFLGAESASIAHDLGNVVFQARIEEILRKKVKKLWETPGDQKIFDDCIKWIDSLENTNSELEAIVKGLAYLSAGRVLEIKKTDLVEIVRSSVLLYSRRIAKERTKLIYDLQNAPVNCDISLKRVVVNLVKNALEAVISESTEEKARELKISCGKKGSEAFFSVTDNGPGIPMDLQNIIFQGHTTKKDGHGLGLSGSKRIVQKHGGRIELNSKPGNGAVFTVYLPLA